MLHADMEDKTYTFQIRVTSYNFTVNHQSFTVSRIINEIECVPAPDFDDNVEAGVNPEDSRMPPFVTGMQGKTYTFHVKLTTYDFTSSRQSFTVTRIINECERLSLPDFVHNGGDDNDGVDMGGEQQIPAQVESKGGSGEAALIAASETIGIMLSDMDDPASQVVKKARKA
ncbi:unnamed protein product [Brassica oleracea]|uniref:Uncharacterized protein n=1 Tax=Brassica oleracea TaxID=3712 RepID=A0A3P6DSD2_BRAOL|nr:unnamed protein product [Brassica oleracea]